MPKFKIKKERKEEPKKEEVKKKTREELEELHAQVKQARAIIFWKSRSRSFQKRGKDYFLTLILLLLFFIFIAAVTREFLLIAVGISLIFVAFVLAKVEPDEIEHKIGKDGIVSGSHSYLWEELRHFWFSKKAGSEILNIETKLRFPARLIILVDTISVSGVKNILSKHLPFREIPEANFIDHWSERLTRLLPLEEN
ncbi:hypothetical protein A2Z23_01030 [Candidatus Curtissbacteria bacterium RBG_16_39_7]|uniref:DUF5673 domain-containing protein n=1 Tax=Candidatus Curtissbacteria bacterium RBG_16_39_7 TaxID=1797707 RepID=A0A1F5G2Z8_9BACT|nr:MAG: hypothetical protein A2Z23_01030 [Candidatus Curtissbacteria bacterium RBG_16_39_7]